MTDYPYDPYLPYVVAMKHTGGVYARFKHLTDAHELVGAHTSLGVIDTTPKPRVPEDATFITYRDSEGVRDYATRIAGKWLTAGGTIPISLEDLPGVTPETVFTVLDERKS